MNSHVIGSLREADMESIVPPHLRRGAFQPSDRLIALLKRPS
jgi:hypothetical protein